MIGKKKKSRSIATSSTFTEPVLSKAFEIEVSRLQQVTRHVREPFEQRDIKYIFFSICFEHVYLQEKKVMKRGGGGGVQIQ